MVDRNTIFIFAEMVDISFKGTAKSIPTDKEKDLVFLLSKGNRPKDIAGIRKVSSKTIEAQIRDLKHKFSCKTVGEIIAVFFRNKLIE